MRWRHLRPLRRLGHLGYVNQFYVEDQVGLGRDTWVVGRVTGNVARPVGKLPGNKEPALAANLHSCKALVEAGDEAAVALREGQRLRVAHHRLSIGPHLRFAIFAHHRRFAVGVRIELFAGRGKVPGVVHVVHHVGRGFSSGTDLHVFVAQRKIGLDDAANLGDFGRQLQPPIAELAVVVFEAVEPVFVVVDAVAVEVVADLAVVWALATAAIAATLKIRAVHFMISLLSSG
jgi:hypothetical protein